MKLDKVIKCALLFGFLCLSCFADEDVAGTDTFFRKELYANLPDKYSLDVVDGAWAGSPGEKLTRKDLSVIALERFEELVVESGIEFVDVSRALFEGDLNPYMIDLELAFEGQVPRDTLSSENVELEFLPEVHRKHFEKPGVPSYIATYYVYQAMRRDMWNANFGSLLEMGPVRTLINGEERDIEFMDLGLRLQMRTRGRGRGGFGANFDPSLSWNKIRPLLEAEKGEQFVGKMMTEIMRGLENECAYSYFRYRGMPKFDFRKDYNDIRKYWYLEKLGSGTDIKTRPGTLR